MNKQPNLFTYVHFNLVLNIHIHHNIKWFLYEITTQVSETEIASQVSH